VAFELRTGGTPLWVGGGALYAYRKLEVVGGRHRPRYQGPWGARPRRLDDGVEDLTGWDVLQTRGCAGMPTGGHPFKWADDPQLARLTTS
jgi:hypothetical protein